MGLKIGLVNGCFDCFHPGHAYFLTEAKKHCDHLIIGMNSDASIRRIKGSLRPYDSTRMRIKNLLPYADTIILFDEDTPIRLIGLIQPDILIRGWDQRDEGHSYVPSFVRIPRKGEYSTSGSEAEETET